MKLSSTVLVVELYIEMGNDQNVKLMLQYIVDKQTSGSTDTGPVNTGLSLRMDWVMFLRLDLYLTE